MKKSILILFIAFAVFQNANAARNLLARLAYATFYAPGEGPYIETYLSVDGNTVVFSPIKNGKFQAAIEVTMIFSQNNEIKHFDKFNLLSPETDDTLKTAFNFLDQQRIKLPNGKYKFELTIRDKNQDAKPYAVNQDVSIDFHENILSVSDIELLEDYKATNVESKLNKGGYDLIPLVDNYFPDHRNTLKFYTEVYNAATVLDNQGYVMIYQIETYENHRVLNNFTLMQRQQSKPVSALIKEIDITELPSGNYNLVIEVRNRNNELLASRELFFQRSKTLAIANGEYKSTEVNNTFVSAYTNKDTLGDYINSLRPISGQQDLYFADNQLEQADISSMQKYFYDFWERKDATNPYQAWVNYKAEVDKVNATYSTMNKKGYETDRGRVYLQYGPPNSISKQYNEPSAYPYEIWHFYKIKNQSNKKFVFYNPDIVGNDFRLIHSDALGEVVDRQWQIRVNKRTESTNDFDRENSRDTYGKQSEEIFKNPR